MSVKLLTEHHLEFLGLRGGYVCSSESTLVKMPHCLKSHVTAQMCFSNYKNTGLCLRVCKRQSTFLVYNQNICFGYSKEPSQRHHSFDNPKHNVKIDG